MNRSRAKVSTRSRHADAPRGRSTAAPILADGPWIARRLLAWYRLHRRDLPWRRTRDPYAIWLSETMLQQTRVATVIPYYHAFLREFPDVKRLARAPIARVLARWSGLGYYRRARHLHASARAIVERHGARVPDDEQALAALPGIGRYTRGAILSMAFDRNVPVLDGNVARVLTRLFTISGDTRSPAVSRTLWERAETLVPRRAPGDFNQALMELGALVCLPRAPRCGGCPVRSRCRAFALDSTERFPTPRVRRRASVRRTSAAILESRSRIWLEALGPGINHGLLDLPPIEARPEHALRLGVVRHAVLETRYLVEVWHVRPASAPRARTGRWVSRAALADAPLTARARKALALLSKSPA